MAEAIAAAARAGVQLRYEGSFSVPLVAPKTDPDTWPRSGAKAPEPPKPEKSPDSLFEFRGGKRHIDMRQARGSVDEIKRWIRDWGAEWHRNKNGSYQAAIYIGEDDEPEEGPEDALDRLQTAAEDVPGPAMLRFGLWYRAGEEEILTRKGGSPKPLRKESEDDDDEETIILEMHYTKLAREFNSAASMANGWRFGDAPEPDRGRLEVMWPSMKGDER